MLIDVRRLNAPALDAAHTTFDVRSRSVRAVFQRGHNVATDYALVQRAAPFIHRMRRSSISVVLDGYGRFDEAGRRAWLEPGTIVLSDQREGGTEAYAGGASTSVVIDWEPAIGQPVEGAFVLGRIDGRDQRRLRACGEALGGARPAEAIAEMLAVLRALGLRLEPRSRADLEAESDDDDASVQTALSAQLSQLHTHPAIDDVSATLGWNARRVHRHVASLAEQYALPFENWRSALHQSRIAQALRLLAAPGATTELVAQITGFRAPAALCHAFAAGGLPSPGVLARAARAEVLATWADAGVDATATAPPPRILTRAYGT